MAAHYELQMQGNPLNLAQVIFPFGTQQSRLEKSIFQLLGDSSHVYHGQRKQDK